LTDVGDNVARAALVATSGDRDGAAMPPTLVNDGRADWRRNEFRWLSSAETPNWVELRWDRPKTIAAARVLSGYNSRGTVGSPIISFVLQYRAGDAWRDIPGSDTTGNSRVDWCCRFEPVTAARVRLLVRETPIQISRIWEIELYERPGS
jgi:hypothetical protein